MCKDSWRLDESQRLISKYILNTLMKNKDTQALEEAYQQIFDAANKAQEPAPEVEIKELVTQ